VESEAARLRADGVAVDVGTFEWGTIGKFLDPDGNRCVSTPEQKCIGGPEQ